MRRTDIRLIAATNQDLQQRIAEGRFRSDLFYRLNVVSLRVPPLRERAEDILLVASYFISRMQLKANRRVEGISSSARRALLHWNWPGNVRELQNVIERAIILGADCEIRLEDLPEELIGTAAEQPTPTGYHAAVLAAKKEILREALASAGGSVVGAAKALGINAKYLHRLLRNIDPKTDDLLPG